MRNQRKQQIPQLQGRALFQPDTFNEKDNTIEVVFATETPVLRNLWGEQYYELLVCDTASVRMQRINQGGPVVDSHFTWSVTDQFGVVEKAWVDTANRVCRALVRLSTTEGDKDTVEKIKTGIIRNVSVGYRIYVSELNESLDNKIPTLRVTDWEPSEISFCPVPADMNSGSRSQQDTNNEVIIIQNTNKPKMKRSAEILQLCRAAGLSEAFATELIDSEKTIEQCRAAIDEEKGKKPAATPPANQQQTNPDEARNEATRTERTRISEIHKAVRATGLPVEFGQTLIDNGTALDQARAAIIDEHARLNPVAPKPQIGLNVGTDASEKKQRGMEAAILQRAGVVKPETAGEPGEFRNMTLLDLAKEALTERGISYRGRSQREIAAMALSMTRDGGGLATGDFSNVLANAMNKTLRSQYALQQRTFLPWTRKNTTSDFKQILRVQLNDMTLQPVQQGGEYKATTLTDSKEAYTVSKYGRKVIINWETIINDDLDAFSRVPGFLANAVAQMQSDTVYGVLNTNAAMGDTVALFHATHGNLAAAGADISVATLAAARAAMRKQKAPGSNSPLNLSPKFLIVGSDDELLALQFLSANYTATKGSDINVFQGTMTPIVESRLDAGTPWYVAADPSAIDTIEYSLLDGEEMFTETRNGFDVDGLEWKVRAVFGAKALDWRGLYKNPGA